MLFLYGLLAYAGLRVGQGGQGALYAKLPAAGITSPTAARLL